MEDNKFATIEIEGEKGNIGVVHLGKLRNIHKDDLKSHFTENVEPALVQALESHFDCPVKVSVPMLEVRTFHPITVEYHVVLETEDEDKRVKVTLSETWIYSALK